MTQTRFANPFKEKGRWFKGNTHVHTTNSDGLLTPEQTTFLYESRGYDFLFITDHWKVSDVKQLNKILPKDFLVIPGIELDGGKSGVETCYHIVALNLDYITDGLSIPYDQLDQQTIINEIIKAGGEAVLAHPYWSALTVNDLHELHGYLGIEIFNTICHFAVAKGYSTIHWDSLLDREKFVLGFAVDDAHNEQHPYRPVDSCYAWIQLKAKKLTTEDVMDSIRKGLFYSSNGPEILDIEINEESISIRSSPVKAVNFISMNGLGERFTALKEPITEIEYKIKGNERYLRIEIENHEGETAWTNPVVFSGN